MSSIRPYTINVSRDDLGVLQRKIELASFPEEIDDSEWEYGASLPDIKRLANHWKSGFDWKKQESKLNELPHFKTDVEIDGFGNVDMHFIHQKSETEGAIPLLFVHGWPGNFLEVTKMLPLLKDNKDGPAFSVVAPSLPNFGFSARVPKKGFSIPQYAESCHKVMLALGYDQYVTQGGDWGFMITRALAHLYPGSVKALHTNWPLAPFPAFSANPVLAATSMFKHALGSVFYTASERADLARSQAFAKGDSTGYLSFFSTKPLTLAYSLNDLPVGLLAFFWEKLHDWTDNYPWTDDEILTWVSIYWHSTAGPGASGFIYKESKDDKIWTRAKLQSWVPQPLAFRYFPKELVALPKGWLSGMGNVVMVGESDKGGHFGAWEGPADIVSDLRNMFKKGGVCEGVVKGKSGY